jgi:GYF domain 2
MKKYFIREGDKEFGPFSIEQLKANNLRRETLVWKAGFKRWISAGEVSELRLIFDKRPSSVTFTKNKIGKILKSNFSGNDRIKKIS